MKRYIECQWIATALTNGKFSIAYGVFIRNSFFSIKSDRKASFKTVEDAWTEAKLRNSKLK